MREPRDFPSQATADLPRLSFEPPAPRAGIETEKASRARRARETGPVRSDDERDVPGTVPHGRAGADQARLVVRHVRNQESNETCRRCPSELPSLDRGERGPQAVHLLDARAGANQPAHGPRLVRERDPGARKTEKRGRAAGQKTEDDVPRSEAREEEDRRPRRENARGIRLGMGGVEDSDAGTRRRRGVAPRQDDQSFPAGAPARREHPRRRFSCGENTDPPGPGQGVRDVPPREGVRDGSAGIDRGERRPIERREQDRGIVIHPNVIFARNRIASPGLDRDDFR